MRLDGGIGRVNLSVRPTERLSVGTNIDIKVSMLGSIIKTTRCQLVVHRTVARSA